MKRLFIGLAFSVSLIAQAQNTPPLAGDSPTADGASLAQQGTKAGVPACVSCHGAQGEGDPASGFPQLSGQASDYMTKQLEDYASGVRANPVMAPIAKALTADERAKVSEYYAGLESTAVKTTAQAKTDKSLLKLGERLARVGDGKLQLQACNNCHGPDGAGEPPLIPKLAGQHASYSEAQLRAWKGGQRKNSPLVMLPVAQRLDDKSIKALAAYFQQVKTRPESLK